MKDPERLIGSKNSLIVQSRKFSQPKHFFVAYESEAEKAEEDTENDEMQKNLHERENFIDLDSFPSSSTEDYSSRGLELSTLNTGTEDPSKEPGALQEAVFFLYDEVGELALEDFDGDAEYDDVGWSLYDGGHHKDHKRIRKDISRSITPKNRIESPRGVLEELDTAIEWNEWQQEHRQIFSKLKTPKAEEEATEKEKKIANWFYWNHSSLSTAEKCETTSFCDLEEMGFDLPDTQSSHILSPKGSADESSEKIESKEPSDEPSERKRIGSLPFPNQKWYDDFFGAKEKSMKQSQALFSRFSFRKNHKSSYTSRSSINEAPALRTSIPPVLQDVLDYEELLALQGWIDFGNGLAEC
mmetsp:Transcript_8657/g.13522  ORF Transcript_8657/g.13522 Transcript_8657/m.13522 type:complete len:356 (-) Transcript_8657:282-1349(-)